MGVKKRPEASINQKSTRGVNLWEIKNTRFSFHITFDRLRWERGNQTSDPSQSSFPYKFNVCLTIKESQGQYYYDYCYCVSLMIITLCNFAWEGLWKTSQFATRSNLPNRNQCPFLRLLGLIEETILKPARDGPLPKRPPDWRCYQTPPQPPVRGRWAPES